MNEHLKAIRIALQIMQADYAKMKAGNTTAFEDEILLPLRRQHIQAAFAALENLFNRPAVEVLVDVLDTHFENWGTAEWDFDASWSGDELVVDLIHLIVDEIPIQNGDPEDMPHPVFKRIAAHVDVIELCREGIVEVNRNDYD